MRRYESVTLIAQVRLLLTPLTSGVFFVLVPVLLVLRLTMQNLAFDGETEYEHLLEAALPPSPGPLAMPWEGNVWMDAIF